MKVKLIGILSLGIAFSSGSAFAGRIQKASGESFASSCKVYVPRLIGKNAEIISQTLSKKGYQVIPTDLIQSNATPETRISEILDTDPSGIMSKLESGDLFLRIEGDVTAILSTQANTQSYLVLDVGGSQVIEMSRSDYKPWIASFLKDPKIVDLSAFPNCEK